MVHELSIIVIALCSESLPCEVTHEPVPFFRSFRAVLLRSPSRYLVRSFELHTKQKIIDLWTIQNLAHRTAIFALAWIGVVNHGSAGDRRASCAARTARTL